MVPTIGRIVHYRLTENQAKNLNAEDDGHDPWRPSEQRDPNEKRPYTTGSLVAGIVISVIDRDTVNLRLFIDRNYPEEKRITSVIRGDGPGEWDWPPRV